MLPGLFALIPGNISAYTDVNQRIHFGCFTPRFQGFPGSAPQLLLLSHPRAPVQEVRGATETYQTQQIRGGMMHAQRRFGVGVLGLAAFALLVPGARAGVIRIDFETNPALPAQPSNFAAAGAAQTYTQSGVYNITGGAVLGNPNVSSPSVRQPGARGRTPTAPPPSPAPATARPSNSTSRPSKASRTWPACCSTGRPSRRVTCSPPSPG